MQTCPHCHVKVVGNHQTCPLCHTKLVGEATDNPFPSIEHKSISTLTFFRVSLFAFVIYLAFLFMCFYFFGYLPWMSLALILGCLAIADIWFVTMYRQNMIKTLHFQTYFLLLISMFVVYEIKAVQWNFSWGYPFVFPFLIVMTFVLGHKQNFQLEDYVIYYVSASFFSLLQIPFILIGWNPNPLPAVLSMVACIVFVAAVFIFHGREVKRAAQKFLNM